MDLIVPDLGLPGYQITLTAWLASPGQRLLPGDAVLELAAADALVELPAPVEGWLVEQCVAEGEEVHVGQVLGRLRVAEDQPLEE